MAPKKKRGGQSCCVCSRRHRVTFVSHRGSKPLLSEITEAFNVFSPTNSDPRLSTEPGAIAEAIAEDWRMIGGDWHMVARDICKSIEKFEVEQGIMGNPNV